MKKDPYEVLGVSRDATAAEIKKTFRQLAQAHHPDKHKGEKGAEEKFKEINAAYEVLKDPHKRARYDQFGSAGPGTGFPEGNVGDLFGDIFSDFFGGGGGGRGRPRAPERGADHRYDMEITFEEAAFGTTKKVKIPKTTFCKSCDGVGAKKGTSPTQCGQCYGTGQQSYKHGFFNVSRPCSTCHGTGSFIKDKCAECAGHGRIEGMHPLTINIPAGVDTGGRLRVVGEGGLGDRNAPPGDLYIILKVLPHKIFLREADDVICEVPITFTDAALGAEIDVPTIEGSIKLKIPAGTQAGKAFRLKGKGIAGLNSQRRGDHHVVVHIETPTKLTEKQKELLKEFASLAKANSHPGKKSFFDKVKEVIG
jgi:molecular chaperone DnaJ